MNKLTEEEKKILESFEEDEWHSKDHLDERKKQLQEYAQNTFKRNKHVNIGISEGDLETLQTIALQEGIPYQTLISSILHKYVSGRLTEEVTVSHKSKEKA